MTRILLADDEDDFRDMVAASLEAAGYDVVQASDGAEAIELLDDGVDLLISDVNMPGVDGFALCREIRASGAGLPVILLTSRDSEIDEALGLDLGADDYITKPVSNRVLGARVRALLRRQAARGGEDESVRKQHGPMRIDSERMQVWVGDAELDLTVTEFRLLACFVDHPGKVLTRDRLLRSMRDDDSFVSDRMVDSYVNRLRRKIEEFAPNLEAIETVIGMGYRLREDFG